ncbi:hypothetical protein TVAG_259900 [Trichomonas vaginalis G3]|uniref:Uncharacterized protein n=1 Tax=Trichomonas vaginalis (strain ATCC PRA-98 / G3) TaxID=412133 RepID=A2E8S3_TRIV3|nr:hypothetical protein TVAGG3_0926990 [Trichomonas vaginalis G3]EAY10905.1 hypothetical protein TVAG_259900 [Trichomonas vaginalis G3]KAI5485557.1 hypothetical protein TVAGG3_0926990 [Trichomonas vaginalis G3]|eukprot:XP_001323128.1 hypothetical protein [Trichomonas vaginalis G3]
MLSFVLAYKFEKYAKIPSKRIPFTDVKNVTGEVYDIISYMRKHYQTGNLTEQDVVTVTPSSRYDTGDVSLMKTSVDCILGHPITNFSGRFVSGSGDQTPNITIDFHAVQIQIESYTFYWTTNRYMRGWNFYGVSPTGLELLSSPNFNVIPFDLIFAEIVSKFSISLITIEF